MTGPRSNLRGEPEPRDSNPKFLVIGKNADDQVEYRRYQKNDGTVVANVLHTDEPLDRVSVEVFRRDPEKLYADFAIAEENDRRTEAHRRLVAAENVVFQLKNCVVKAMQEAGMTDEAIQAMLNRADEHLTVDYVPKKGYGPKTLSFADAGETTPN